MPIKKGSHVIQVVPACEGVVLKKQFNDTLDQFQYLVEFIDAAGEPVRRWFNEDQIAEGEAA